MNQKVLIVASIFLVTGIVGGLGIGYLVFEPKITSLKDKASNLTLDISNLRQTVSSQETYVSSLESEKSSLQADLDSTQSLLSSYKNQTTSLKSRVSSLETNLTGLQSKMNKILSITANQGYAWSYQGVPWNWDLPIPLSLYDEYLEKSRPTQVWFYLLKVSTSLYLP